MVRKDALLVVLASAIALLGLTTVGSQAGAG